MASKLRKFLDIAGLYKLITLVKQTAQAHWIGTQAEYDAQKSNIPAGAIVALTDEEDTTYDHGKFSTVETVTGMRWVDGKPIYRKVITGNLGSVTSSAYTSVWVKLGVEVNEIIDIRGCVEWKNSGTHTVTGWVPFSFPFTEANNNISTWYILDDGNSAHSNTVALRAISSLYNNRNFKIIVEYTKPND